MIEWIKWHDKVVPMNTKATYIVASGQGEDLDICTLWLHEGDWKWVNENNVCRYALEDDHYAVINLPGEDTQ